MHAALIATALGVVACTRASAQRTPASIEAQEALVEERVAQGRVPEAVSAARRLVELAPDAPESYDVLGEMLLCAGDLSGARRAFEAALTRAPQFATAYHGIAMVELHGGNVPAAVAALTRGVASTRTPDPTYVRTRLLEAIAWAAWFAGDEREALAAIDESVTAQGLPPEVAGRVIRIGHARMFLQRGRWDEARAELADARAPGAPPRLERVARGLDLIARIGAGRLAEAELELASLRTGAPADDADVLQADIALALARRDLTVAAAAIARLGSIDPFAAELAELELARALRAVGREGEACQRMDNLAARYLRSASSAYVRRRAIAER